MVFFSAHIQASGRFRVAIFCLLLAVIPILAILWPLDALQISHAAPRGAGEETILQVPALLGRTVRNTIIHSVQLTPVIDEYRIQEGRIWAWRERIMSHNAGLPSLKPDRGRFVFEPPWMIVEGTGASWENFLYRVGTETLGRNELCIFPRPCRELWREMPGKRLVFRVVAARL